MRKKLILFCNPFLYIALYPFHFDMVFGLIPCPFISFSSYMLRLCVYSQLLEEIAALENFDGNY